MVKKLSDKQITDTSDDTFTVYFNYNLSTGLYGKCIVVTVVLTLSVNLKFWILNKDVEAYICLTQRNPWILANKINHEQKQYVSAGL